MKKYIFVTHVDLIEISSDEFKPEFHCNYYSRVDDLLQEFLVSQLADEEPSSECQELARTLNQLGLVSRFNPQKSYKMSIVVFDDDDNSDAEIIEMIEKQDPSTIQMIRKSGDTHRI